MASRRTKKKNDIELDNNVHIDDKKYNEREKNLINTNSDHTINKSAKSYDLDQKNGYQQGFLKGEKEGFIVGLDKALLEFNKKNDVILTKMNNLLVSFEQSLAELDDVIASRIVHLALSIAKKVIESNSYSNDQNLLNKIRELLRNEKIVFNKPKLFIHPNDKEIVEKNFGTIFSKYGWLVFYDIKVSMGGCIISSGDTILDSTIFGRWTELCRLVLKKRT
ncbi:FliH/SctL family protein [Buchnera aphidicola]|nr:FliH/SctL family protein [Buchnera aphidicola]